MKKLLFLLLLGLNSLLLHAQQTITFERSYADSGQVEGRRIRQTFDGGYIVAGRRNTPAVFFSNDATLMKIDSLGNVEWVKVYGTTIDDDWLNDVQQTADSGFIACGFYPEIGLKDNLYVIKTDKNGNTLWTKIFSSVEAERAYAITQTYDGGYAMVGIWEELIGFIFRMNAQGDTLWTRYPTPPNGVALYSITQTIDSGFVATGLSSDSVMNLQAYVIRLDKNGNVLWEKNYGYTDGDLAKDIIVLPDGNYLAGGYSWQPPNDYDAYLIKLAPNGDTLWTRLYSAPRENGIVEFALANNGTIVFAEAQSTTSHKYQSHITKIDSMGTLLWRRAYGGIESEYLYGITACQDGGFAICNYSDSFGPLPKAYVVKTNPQGLLTALVRIKDNQTAHIKVGPNPFEDNITLFLSELPIEDYHVILYSALGQTILHQKVQGGDNVPLQIPTHLPPATYYLKIQNSKKVLASFSLIRR